MPIAFVNGGNTDATGSGTATITFLLTWAQNAGDTIVVAFGNQNSVNSLGATPVQDTAGNTWVAIRGPDGTGSGVPQWLYRCSGCKASGASTNTVTVTFSATTADKYLFVTEYSGIDTSSPVDSSNTATGNSGTASVSDTTTAANCLLYAVLNNDGNAGAAVGSGYTSRGISTNLNCLAEDQIVSSAGAQTATATLTAAIWNIQIVALKAATATGLEDGGQTPWLPPPEMPWILSAGVSEDIAIASPVSPFDEGGPTPFWTVDPQPFVTSVSEEFPQASQRLTGRAYASPVGLGGFLLFGLNLQPTDAFPEDSAGIAFRPTDDVASGAFAAMMAMQTGEDFVGQSSSGLEDGGAAAFLSQDASPQLPTPWIEDIAFSAVEELSQYWVPDPVGAYGAFAIPPVASEDLASSAAPYEESGPTPVWIVEYVPYVTPISEDLASAATPFDEAGTPPALYVELVVLPVLVGEDSISLPLEEPAGQAWAPPSDVLLVPLGTSSEDFQGFLTIDDTPGPTANAVAVDATPVLVTFPEDASFASTVGLDESAQPVLVLEPQAWIWAPNTTEDLARSAAPYDEAAPTWVAPEILPWLGPTVGEDVAPQTATGLDEGAFPVLVLEPATWISAPQVPEDVARAAAPFDESASTWVFPEVQPWFPPAIGEDFVQTATTGLEDGPGPTWLPTDQPTWVGLALTSEDVVALATFEEAGTAAWLSSDQPTAPPASTAEDFAGALPSEDGAGSAWVSAEASTWLPSISAEDFCGSLPAEDSSGAALFIAESLWGLAPQQSEDVPGARPLEETAGAVSLFAEPPAWVVFAPGEEILLYLPIEETGLPFSWPQIPEPPWRFLGPWLFGEDWVQFKAFMLPGSIRSESLLTGAVRSEPLIVAFIRSDG